MNSKRLLILAMMSLACCGCATMNFSAHYYTPPSDYQDEAKILFHKVTSDLPLKRNYGMRIVTEQESKSLKGIPAISNATLILPDNFLKYVYQNYYDDRHIIITCIIAHEICHTEFGLASSPPEAHVKTDIQAIALLGTTDTNTPALYYKSLRVMHNYWFARKGVAGHTFNVGWNIINAAAMVFGLPGIFVDWYATDLNQRLKFIAHYHNLNTGIAFQQSHSS
ncbi:hypothetical protein ACFL38_04625 [Candidatus Omnitrophota bacterium]